MIIFFFLKKKNKIIIKLKKTCSCLNHNLVEPLCHGVENDLRLHIHMHLKVADRNPFATGVRDLTPFLRMPPLRVFDESLNLKANVEHYLDTSFYNLNTVALFDWKTYAEMRNLAKEKYGLTLIETHLPATTLDQVSTKSMGSLLFRLFLGIVI